MAEAWWGSPTQRVLGELGPPGSVRCIRLGIAWPKFHPRLVLASPGAAPQRSTSDSHSPWDVSGNNISPDLRGQEPSQGSALIIHRLPVLRPFPPSIPEVVSFCTPSKPRCCHPPLLISQSPHTPCARAACLFPPGYHSRGLPGGLPCHIGSLQYRIHAAQQLLPCCVGSMQYRIHTVQPLPAVLGQAPVWVPRAGIGVPGCQLICLALGSLTHSWVSLSFPGNDTV